MSGLDMLSLVNRVLVWCRPSLHVFSLFLPSRPRSRAAGHHTTKRMAAHPLYIRLTWPVFESVALPIKFAAMQGAGIIETDVPWL